MRYNDIRDIDISQKIRERKTHYDEQIKDAIKRGNPGLTDSLSRAKEREIKDLEKLEEEKRREADKVGWGTIKRKLFKENRQNISDKGTIETVLVGTGILGIVYLIMNKSQAASEPKSDQSQLSWKPLSDQEFQLLEI